MIPDITNLTREQELALIEALEPENCGYAYSPSPPSDVVAEWRALDSKGIVKIDRTEGVRFTPAGHLLAQALKDRDEARRNYQFMVERAAGEKLDGYKELGERAAKAENDRDRLHTRLAETQRAMHSAGHKSAAAMLNPLLRGDDE